MAALLAPLILGATAWAGPDQTDAPIAIAGPETVAVDVVVTDRQGQPVTGLTVKDFVLREDDAIQDLTTFEAVALGRETAPEDVRVARSLPSTPLPSTNVGERRAPGRTFVLVFDDLHLGDRSVLDAKRAVGRFLDTAARPGDLVTLVVAGTGLVWSALMPEGRDALEDVLKPIRGRRTQSAAPISEHEAVRIVKDHDAGAEEAVRQRFQLGGTSLPGILPATADGRPGGKGAEEVRPDPGQFVQSEARRVFDGAQRQRRRVLEVTSSVLEGLADVKGRKSILLVSEGFVGDPDEPQLRELVSASRKGNAAIYYVHVRGPVSEGNGAPAGSEAGRSTDGDETEGAEITAIDTGGFALRDGGDLDEGLARISRESSSYYLVGYSSTNPQHDGRFRKISLEVARPDVTVRARAGYYAPSEEKKDSGKAARRIDPQLESALRRPCAMDQIPLRLTAFVFQPVGRGRTRVTLASEIGVKDLDLERGPGGVLTTSVDVAVAVVHVTPGASVVMPWREWTVSLPAEKGADEGWAPIQSTFELPPGRCQAKLVVRNRKTGALGSVIHTFEVPEPEAGRVSSPVLSDTPPTTSDGRPTLLARRDFPAEGKLYCYFEVYDAARDPGTGKPRVSFGYSLVDENGEVKLTEPPKPIAAGEGGRLARLMEVPLTRVPPGEYDLVLSVRDEAAGRTRELREPFRVGQTLRHRADVYVALVRAYLEGGASDAISRLARWSPGELAKGVATLPADDERLRRAALLLHTDIAIDRWRRGAVEAGASHLATARSLLDGAASPTLQRDWLLALGYYHQSRSSWAEALSVFTECARLYPDVAEAWLGAGAAHEYTAYPDGIGGDRLAEAPHAAAQEAERCYREAIRLDPGLAEARLRLGRVLRLTGRLQEAEKEWAAAVAASREGYVTGLAHLFWGELCEGRGDLAAAIRHYRGALEADVDLQPAALALSHALRATGRARDAAEILPPALRASEDTEPNPWLQYHLGLGRLYRPAMTALREGVPAVAGGSTP